MSQEPYDGTPPRSGDDQPYPDATLPNEPGQFGADRPDATQQLAQTPPPLPVTPPPPTPPSSRPQPGTWNQSGQSDESKQLGWQGLQQQPQEQGWPDGYGASGPDGYGASPAGGPWSAQGYPRPSHGSAGSMPGDPRGYSQQPYQGGDPQGGFDRPKKASRTPLWIVLGLVTALVLLGAGLFIALTGGQKAEAECTSFGCTLTLTRAGSGVDLTTAEGVKKIRQEGIDGDRATFSVDGQDRTCQRNQSISAAGLTFTCSVIAGDILELEVTQ